jgi:hypothetical protein
MSEHSEIMTEMQAQLDAYGDAIIVMPSALAAATFASLSPEGGASRVIEYLSLQMLNAMARKLLGRKFSHESDDTDAYSGDLFSGALQPRYPLPRKRGEEPVYKLRCQLTDDERSWNVEQLRKSAQARLEHADALEAEGDLRSAI